MDRTAEINLWTDRIPVTDGRLEEFVSDPIACMRRLHREHGDLAAFRETSEKQQQLVFVFSPELNHHVLSDSKTFHSQFFTLRGPRNSSQRHLTCGLLSMNGDEHKQQRRQVAGPFEKRSISIHHETVTAVTDQMLATWASNSVVDMSQEMTILMRKITSMILFGTDQLDLALEIGEMLDQWVELNHQLGLAAFIPRDDFMPEYNRMLSYAEKLESRILDLMKWRREAGTLGADLLSQLIRVHDTTGGITNEQLVGHVALLFGAAHMTSAYSLGWTLFLLAQHPEVMTSLNHELQAGIYDEPLAAFDSAKGSLLDRVLRESMRLLPASSYSQRINDVPIEFGPFSLPRGTPIIFSSFVTHHRPDLYPEPDRFQPDRWLTISPTPYEYLPFGAGPRMCLGAPLAQFIIKTILPRILKHNRLSVVAGAEVNGLVVSTMLNPISGIPMHVAEPDGRFATSAVTGNIHSLVDLPAAALQRRAAA
ncbi:MAG: cytochrome P450 [Planctomycetia bacterium]|nr:cytochrome P450 [Planctomycetia bacterium]